MRDETLHHTCTISWGMLVGSDTDKYIKNLIDKKKREVRLAFMRCGYLVKDQHFSENVEWGTLHTWAELIDNPEGISGSIQGDDINMGYFYDEEKQRQHLNLLKMNLKTQSIKK